MKVSDEGLKYRLWKLYSDEGLKYCNKNKFHLFVYNIIFNNKISYITINLNFVVKMTTISAHPRGLESNYKYMTKKN